MHEKKHHENHPAGHTGLAMLGSALPPGAAPLLPSPVVSPWPWPGLRCPLGLPLHHVLRNFGKDTPALPQALTQNPALRAQDKPPTSPWLPGAQQASEEPCTLLRPIGVPAICSSQSRPPGACVFLFFHWPSATLCPLGHCPLLCCHAAHSD